MAITYTSNNVNSGMSPINSPITSGTLALSTNDIVVVMFVSEDEYNTGNLSVTNSGTELSWNLIALTDNLDNCKVQAWWAKATTVRDITVTVSWDGNDTQTVLLSCRVHTGAHLTDPVPAGKVYSGASGTDISQSITPTASGSALWMACGDWSATNSFAAIANCTLEANYHLDTRYSGCIVRPTTQPRTNGSAFTLGETDTAGKIAWISFEVQAAAGATLALTATLADILSIKRLN